jgi:hypothetical protein
MDKKFIFVFILLATLSIVNAIPPQLRKRVTLFEPCPKAPPITVSKVVPDPLVPGGKSKFSVSGKLVDTIPLGYEIGAFFYNLDGAEPILIDFFATDICTPKGILDCPFPAKTPFTGVLSGTAPAALPKAYGMLVLIGDAKFNTLIGCARAFVGGAQPVPASPEPAPSPTSSPPPPPPPPPPPSSPAPSAPAPPASSPSSSGKGSGGIQDSIINQILN